MTQKYCLGAFSQGTILAAIKAGIAKLGKDGASVTVKDLGSVAEFHIGGRMATKAFLDSLGLSAKTQILDVDCGHVAVYCRNLW